MDYLFHNRSLRISVAVAIMALISIAAFAQYTQGATCSLDTKTAYKTAASPSVYYISDDCKKRPIRNPAVFFSHFDSWDVVRVTSEASLRSIPDHELSFLPWGPRRDFTDGTLLKTVTDPRVYLKVGSRIYPVSSEETFLGLGYLFSWIEDVSADVLAKYQQASQIASASNVPVGVAFKYPNDARVYILDSVNDQLRKRHVRSLSELQRRYRADRVITLPLTRVFQDGEAVRDTVPTTPVPTTASPSENRGSGAPLTDRGSVSSVGIADTSRAVSRGRLSEPAHNQTVIDPAFGTTIRRITDTIPRGAWATQVYSQLQAFSDDSTYVMLIEDADTVVRRTASLASVNIANFGNFNVPRWYSDSELFFFDDNADEILRAQIGNLTTGQVRTVHTFPERYDRIDGNRSYDELSHDSRWVAGMASSGDDDLLFAFDIVNNRIGAELSLTQLFGGPCQPDRDYGIVPPDWVGMSPSGQYLAVQWATDGTERCNGLETFNASTGAFVGRVYDGHQHGDLGMAPDGREYFMTFETEGTPEGQPYIGIRYLPGPSTGVASPTYLTMLSWDVSGGHISCQGTGEFCAVSTYEDPGGPFDSEIFLQYIDGSVLRVAHHRSTACGYWTQPRPSISPDSRRVIFASDWGVDRCDSNDGLGRGEAYIIELPADIRTGR